MGGRGTADRVGQGGSTGSLERLYGMNSSSSNASNSQAQALGKASTGRFVSTTAVITPSWYASARFSTRKGRRLGIWEINLLMRLRCWRMVAVQLADLRSG